VKLPFDFRTSPELRARLKGVLVIRNTKYGPKAQAWPTKTRKALTPYERYKRTEFAYAAMWARLPDELARITAENLVKGTQYVWRDILMSAMYGNYYIIFDEHGNQMDQFRMVAPNPQLVLDLVGDTPGSMLYRSDEGWVLLLPPSMNSMLYWEAGAPVWGPSPEEAGGRSVIIGNPNVASTSAFTQATNFLIGTQAIVRAGDTISAVAFVGTAASATTKITPAIYDDGGLTPNALIASGPQVTGTVKGLNVFPLTTPISFANDAIIWLAVQTAVANFGVCKSQAGTNFFKANIGAPPATVTTPTIGAASGNITVFALQ
jgi:hypothetical protein